MTCSFSCSSSATGPAYSPRPADRQRRVPLYCEAAMPPIARVEPLTTTRALRGPFDYRLPEALMDVGVGTLLSVPFAGRQLLGVVVERADASEVPPERLAEPHARVEPAIPAELVGLARWIGE